MQRRNTILAVLGIVLGLIIIIVVALNWSTPTACVPVVVPVGVDTANCPVGGSICGGSEGQHCAGTWPFRDHCETVYITGGTCACRCQ